MPLLDSDYTQIGTIASSGLATYSYVIDNHPSIAGWAGAAAFILASITAYLRSKSM